MSTLSGLTRTKADLAASRFDEACGYRTEEQAAAIDAAIEHKDAAGLLKLMTVLRERALDGRSTSIPLSREEEKERERADARYDVFKDIGSLAMFRVQA